MSAGETVSQRAITRSWVPRLTLVPPLAGRRGTEIFSGDNRDPDLLFGVYGDDETNERCRKWALRHHYLLATGIDACAHGLYMMECPGPGIGCRDSISQGGFGFDHTSIWVPADPRDERPFILTHPYVSEVPGRMRVYAEAHGLDLSSPLDALGDIYGNDWYGTPGHTLPIRFTVPDHGTVWPIEEQALALLSVYPMDWPGDDE